MEAVKEFIKKNFKRLFMAVAGGFVFGFVATLVGAAFAPDKEISGFIMIPIILAGAVVGFFVLKNNKDFKK